MKLNLKSAPKTKEEATTNTNSEEVDVMLSDLELTKYYERVVNDQLTPKEKQARKNTEKLLNTSLMDIFEA